jgi:chemotaxis signal transduction protein
MNKTNLLDNIAAILVVTISNRKFCFDIHNILTTVISEQAIIKSNPDNSYFIEIGKNFIPLIDFGSLFNLINNKDDNDSRIIILEINNNKIGFYVDRIEEIINFDGRKKDLLKFNNETDTSSYSAGILIYEDEYIYPNLPKIFEDIFTQSKINSE